MFFRLIVSISCLRQLADVTLLGIICDILMLQCIMIHMQLDCHNNKHLLDKYAHIDRVSISVLFQFC